jgi:superfamily I DNA/RNA helicase
MTIHKSKNLEFQVIFCIGLVDGIMPNICWNIEEARRVAFVGIFRAMAVSFVYDIPYDRLCIQ